MGNVFPRRHKPVAPLTNLMDLRHPGAGELGQLVHPANDFARPLAYAHHHS